MSKPFDLYDFKKKEIDGVPVYYKNLPFAPCINLYLAFGTGAFSDPVGKEGVSHFLEHMIFDGSPKLKNKKIVQDWSKKYALNSWNAWTSSYQTVYSLKCLPENFKTVLTGMNDLIFKPFLRSEDVEHERGVIMQETWRAFKNKKYMKFSKEVADNIMHGHNFARVILPVGWPDTVSSITREDIVLWHSLNYVKANMRIVITGNISNENIALFSEFIKKVPEREFKPFENGIVPKPKILKIQKTSEEIGDPKEQAEISIIRCMSYVSKDKSQIVSFFSRLMSDILNEKLRFSMGICYHVSFGSWVADDFCETSMNIKTDEKNIGLVQDEFYKILSNLEKGEYKSKFTLIKKMALDQIRSREFLSDDIAHEAVNDLSRFDGEIMKLQDRIYLTNKIKYSDIVKIAKETFNPEYTYTEIILPSKKN